MNTWRLGQCNVTVILVKEMIEGFGNLYKAFMSLEKKLDRFGILYQTKPNIFNIYPPCEYQANLFQ